MACNPVIMLRQIEVKMEILPYASPGHYKCFCRRAVAVSLVVPLPHNATLS